MEAATARKRVAVMTAKAKALTYAARGWRVFPVWNVKVDSGDRICACDEGRDCERPGKHPCIEAWQAQATTEVVKIENWWMRWPSASIGIATGRESGITVIDADASAGKPGVVNLTALCAAHGGVPATLIAKTGGGGLHLYFKHSTALPTGTNVLGEAIDVRNDGGYVIAPPSSHLLGAYTWANEDRLQQVEPLLELPDWMRPPSAEQSRRGRGRPRGSRNAARHLTLDQVADALRFIDHDDRDRWRNVGLILGRAFVGTPAESEVWTLYDNWSRRSDRFDSDSESVMREHFYRLSQQEPSGGRRELTIGTFIQWARENGWPYEGPVESYNDFYAIRPANKYLYIPSGALWPAESVNKVLPPRMVGRNDRDQPVFQNAAEWLMKERGVDSMVFDPALPQIVEGKVAREQGVIEHDGAILFNRYQPSLLEPGEAAEGERWADHVRKLFPNAAEAEHIIRVCAHRVQRPGEKVRHALLIGGPPGVGKDTIFDALIPALGAWNTASISPDEIFKPFNEYSASVLLRINEVVDLHEISRYKFYEATKTLIAGSPEYIEVNPKYGAKYHVRNCACVVMTTNYGSTGMYLTADDRRHFAVETIELWGAQAERDTYFRELWNWLLQANGFAHVAAYLRGVNLDDFDPNAPPPKTATFWKIAASGTSSDGWLIDALARLGDPAMVRGDTLRSAITADMKPQEVSRALNPAMARLMFEPFPNPARKDGRHRFTHAGRESWTAVYVKRGTPAEQLPALLGQLLDPDRVPL